MEALLILLLFPLAWPFIAKRIWHSTINWTEMTVQIVLVSAITTGVWHLGKYGQTRDVEIWNGYITSKDRDHGHYLRPYECNCYESCSGTGSSRTCTRHCSTCYEDRYTVTWSAESTVGYIQFEHLDSGFMSVYNTPDPAVYKRCKIGEPASREHAYTNYVQAVPESLFHDDRASLKKFEGKIPSYPRVYDFYRINRVVGDLAGHTAASNINERLNNVLKTDGGKYQVNVVVVLTDIDDPSYRYAVEQAWLGGNKNDVIVVVGLDGDTITWSDTITWALNKGNELLSIKLRDGVKELETLDPDKFVTLVSTNIGEHFTRPEMAQFEYLKDEIDPPLWVIILAIILAVGGSLGLSVVFHRYEMEDYIGGLFRARPSRRNRYYR